LSSNLDESEREERKKEEKKVNSPEVEERKGVVGWRD
jgi:hypothetical protein